MKRLICILITMMLLLSSTISFACVVQVDSKNNSTGNQKEVTAADNFSWSNISRYSFETLLKQLNEWWKKDKEKRNDLISSMARLKTSSKNYLMFFYRNGIASTYNLPFITQHNTLLFDLETIAKAAGGSFSYNKASNTGVVNIIGMSVIVRPGSKKVIINGKEVSLNHEVVLNNSKVMVPFKFIQEIFKNRVEISNSKRYIIIDNEVTRIVNDKTAGNGLFQFEYVGKWIYGRQSGAYMGDNHWSVIQNPATYDGNSAYCKFKFNGTQVMLYGAKAPGHGIAAVSIDNGTETIIDYYAATRTDNALVYTSPVLPAGQHTLKIRVTGSKNASSSGNAITIDKASVSLYEVATVTPAPTPVPGATPTPVPTPSPTPVPTPSPTPAPTPTFVPTVKYEAERADLSKGAVEAKNHSGYTGSGFVSGMWNPGASVTFRVSAVSAGGYNVAIRYANSSGSDKTLSVYVNGVKIRQTTLANLANWDTWAEKTELLVLNAGTNLVSLIFDNGDTGNVNLDSIVVSPMYYGQLSGSSAAISGNVILSNEGLLDWVHWGMADAAALNRKAGVTALISNFSKIGTGNVSWIADTPLNFTWTGGTPVITASNISSGVFTAGRDNGFLIMVPADSVQKTLKLYVSAWKAKVKLEAMVSDGTTPAFTAYLDSHSGTSSKVFTINYKTTLTGSLFLIVKFTVTQSYEGNYGNVILQGAALN